MLSTDIFADLRMREGRWKELKRRAQMDMILTELEDFEEE